MCYLIKESYTVMSNTILRIFTIHHLGGFYEKEKKLCEHGRIQDSRGT